MNLEELLRTRFTLREMVPYRQLFVDYYQGPIDLGNNKLDFVSLTEHTDKLLREYPLLFDEVLPVIYDVNVNLAESVNTDAADPKNITLKYDFLYRAAETARLIFETGTGNKKADIQWGEASYNCFLQVGHGVESESKYRAARAYQKAGVTAMKLFEISGNLKWLSRSMSSYNYAAFLMLDVNEKESAYLYAKTAQRASELYDRTGSPGVLKTGIDACNIFFSYYKMNPVADLATVNREAKSSWRVLTSKK